VRQVVTQTPRRVIPPEAGPASEKRVSLFEPHTAIIRKGNPGKPTEFGRVLWLDEVEGGISRRYAVLAGNPAEEAQLPPSLAHHLRVFHRPPRRLAGDRGVHATAPEQYAATQGVKEGGCPNPEYSQPSAWPRSSHDGSGRGTLGV
jgi:IS5 family transposase